MSRFLHHLLRRPATDEPEALPGARPAVAAVGELLHEDDVSLSTLLRLFRQAYLPVESQPGERLLVTTESGVHLHVSVDAPRRLIGFAATYLLHPDAGLADKLAFVNRVNDRVVFVRFSLLGDDRLYVDHQLPYDGGVTAAAVIGCVRRLGRIAPQAIQEFAEPGLMK